MVNIDYSPYQIIRQAAKKFLGHKYQHPGDSYMVSLVELLRIITRFSETVAPILNAKQGISAVSFFLHSQRQRN